MLLLWRSDKETALTSPAGEWTAIERCHDTRVRLVRVRTNGKQASAAGHHDTCVTTVTETSELHL